MNFIKRMSIMLALLPASWGCAQSGLLFTNSFAANRILMVDASSMPVAGGKATLTIGMLRRADGVYTGDYKVRVFPYFFENDKGRLAVIVSDKSMAEISVGKITEIVATATASGKNARSSTIAATVTPTDINHGTLKLLVTVSGRKMIFEPAYHFAENTTPMVLTNMIVTNLAPPQFLVAMQKP